MLHRLHPFPNKRNKALERETWLRAIRRADPKHGYRYLEPRPYMRVCSEHFVNGEPSDEHPNPELKLGHTNTTPSKPRAKRKLSETTTDCSDVSEDGNNCSDDPRLSPNVGVLTIAFKFMLVVMLSVIRTLKSTLHAVTLRNRYLESEHDKLRKQYEKLHQKNNFLIRKIMLSKAMQQLSHFHRLYQKMLANDKNVKFYTGVPSLESFNVLHDTVKNYVVRRWKGVASGSKRQYRTSLTGFGPNRKLTSKQEFLLVLMKLRLGVLNKHLADFFGVSEGLVSQILHSWLHAMSKIFDKLIIWPTKRQVKMTQPDRFKTLPDLRIILDCSEIFIETPKDLKLQSATWSNYKHHHTGKFLVGVAPNSSITFVSPVYNGRASDKLVTLASGLLDSSRTI